MFNYMCYHIRISIVRLPMTPCSVAKTRLACQRPAAANDSLQFGRPSRSVPKPGCWEIGFSYYFLEYLDFIPYTKPINKSLFEQSLSIVHIVDLQEHIYTKVKKPTACRPDCFGNLSITMFLEIQNIRYSQILYLVNYTACRLHL